MKNLPIGIQSFESLRENNFIYIDKTKLVYDLLSSDKGAYFLSRPRRFGKSLLISTLEAIFKNQKELFKGLWIESSDYNWQQYPIIKIDFPEIPNKAGQLEQGLKDKLSQIASKHKIRFNTEKPLVTGFSQFMDELVQKTGKKVIVLIDEYDKPIIDNITEIETASENRSILKTFYGILKPQDENLKFVFLTGVSKFSRVSIFSDLNNLNDITMDTGYAALLGYTQKELEHYFADRIVQMSKKQNSTRNQLLFEIKRWYNGYWFSKENIAVYNPFSTLLLFDKQEFNAYWFETGTPTFLIKLLKKKEYPLADLNNLEIGEKIFPVMT